MSSARFKIPNEWTRYERVNTLVADWIQQTEGIPAKERNRLWAEKRKDLKQIAEVDEAAEALRAVAPAGATARIKFFWQQGELDIGEEKFALMRRPERFNTRTGNKLKALEGKNIERDTPDYAILLDILHSSGADNVISIISNLHSKLTHLVIEDVQVSAAAEAVEAVDLAEEPLGRFHARISGRGLPPVRVSVSALGQLSFSPGPEPADGLCLPRAISTHFGAGFRKAWRKKTLSIYEVFPNKPVPITAARGFFEQFRLSATAWNIKGDHVWSYRPKSPNSAIQPNSIHVLIHNQHAWLLNSAPRRRASQAPAVGSRFHPPKIASDTVAIHGWSELIAFIRSTELCTGKRFRVFTTEDAEPMFFKFCDQGFEPVPIITGGCISGFRLSFQNEYVITDDPLENPEEGRVAITATDWPLYSKYVALWSAALFDPRWRSEYSPDFLSAIASYSRGPLVCRFADATTDASAALSIDIVKAYTANLRDLPGLPQFHLLECWEDFAEPVEPLTLYLAEPTANSPEHFIVGNLPLNLCYGFTLAAARDLLTPLRQMRPCQVFPNRLGPLIQQTGDALPPDLRKFLVNSMIGLCNKRKNTREWGYYTTSSREAYSLADASGVARLSAEQGARSARRSDVARLPGSAFLASFKHTDPLRDGYLPIGLAVLDYQRLRMLQVYRRLAAAGATPIAISTDAFLVPQIPSDLLTGTQPGDLRIEGLKRIPPASRSGASEASRVPTGSVVEPAQPPAKLACVWNPVDAEPPGTLVLAELPGAGKTELLARKLQDPRSAPLWLCATNSQAQRITMQYNQPAWTLCRFLGFRLVQGVGLVQCRPAGAGESKTLIIDELYQQSLRLLASFAEALRLNPSWQVYATGDPSQAPPADRWNNIPNRISYINNRLNLLGFCHVRYLGWQSWRFTDPADIAKLRAAAEAPTAREMIAALELKTLDNVEAARAIGIRKALTLSNASSELWNRAVASDPLRESVGSATLICKRWTPGLALNAEYEIKCSADSTVELVGFPGRSFPRSAFRGSASRTSYALQGATLDEPYVILDADSPNATREWLWVCTTRARRLADVWVYTGPSLSRCFNPRPALLRHRLLDYALGRENDLTAEWVRNQLSSQNYFCAICDEPMDLASGNEHSWSIDRVDNTLGHTQANCQITHKACNCAKR